MRVLFFDQIKALMIALVISVHVFLALLGDWLGVHIAMSSSPHPLFVGVAVWVMSFSNTFYVHAVSALGLSLQDRLLRLGLPFVGGMLLINNVSVLLGRFSCKHFGDIALERYALESRDGAVVSVRAVCF